MVSFVNLTRKDTCNILQLLHSYNTNIPPQHKIGKPIMIYCGDVAANHNGENTLLTNINWLYALQASVVIT